jgi:hypothetical protein
MGEGNCPSEEVKSFAIFGARRNAPAVMPAVPGLRKKYRQSSQRKPTAFRNFLAQLATK